MFNGAGNGPAIKRTERSCAHEWEANEEATCKQGGQPSMCKVKGSIGEASLRVSKHEAGGSGLSINEADWASTKGFFIRGMYAENSALFIWAMACLDGGSLCAHLSYVHGQSIPSMCGQPSLSGAASWLCVCSQLGLVCARAMSMHARGLGRRFKSSHGLHSILLWRRIAFA